MRLFALLLSLFLALGPASAQAPVAPDPAGELLAFFYKDPRPERLIGYFEQYESSLRNWHAYPPVAGVFAVAFRTHPSHIERLIPAHLNPKSAATLAAALQLSGQSSLAAKLRPMLQQAGSDEN